MIELDIPPNREGSTMDIAQVHIHYNNMETRKTDSLVKTTNVSFTKSENTVEEMKDKETLVEAVKQIATETKEQAILLRDKGQVDEARQLMEDTADLLFEGAEELESEELFGLGELNSMDAEAMEDDAGWNANRKRMKKESYEMQNQQSY